MKFDGSHGLDPSFELHLAGSNFINLGVRLPTSEIHYRPILLARTGERQGLQDLTDEDHGRFTPIFVAPPRAWNFQTETVDKTLTQHLEKLPAEFGKARGGRDAYIDLCFLTEDLSPVDGMHPLQWLYEHTLEEGVNLIPVVSANSPGDLIAAARDLHSAEDMGVCLRLLPADWPSADPKAFKELLDKLEVGPADVDLVLDLGEDTATHLTLRALAPEIVWARANGSWRSLTVAGAGMPAPKDLPGKGINVLERTDWLTYRQVSSFSASSGIEVPDYSDYGVANYDPVLEVDPRMMNISATFRYTTHEVWLFGRGDLFKGNGGRGLGGAAVAPMLSKLRAHTLYSETTRDLANDWIDTVVDQGASGGQPTVWRRWATYHHIKTVVGQLSS